MQEPFDAEAVVLGLGDEQKVLIIGGEFLGHQVVGVLEKEKVMLKPNENGMEMKIKKGGGRSGSPFES